jgi:hypothetical protein
MPRKDEENIPFCIDCPDHAACVGGVPCEITKSASGLESSNEGGGEDCPECKLPAGEHTLSCATGAQDAEWDDATLSGPPTNAPYCPFAAGPCTSGCESIHERVCTLDRTDED